MNIYYLEDFSDLKKYENIILTDNLCLRSLNNNSKKTLILLYPNQKDLQNNVSKNIEVKNLPLSIFNKDYSFRWKSHRQSKELIESHYEKMNLVSRTPGRLINFLANDKRIGFYFKNFFCNQIEKVIFYNNIATYLKKINRNIEVQISDPELSFIYSYLRKSQLFTSEVKFFFIKKNNFLKSLKNFFILLLYPLYSLLQVKISSNKKLKKINLCIRHNWAGFGINEFPKISEDWILDDNIFTKENSLFVIEDEINDLKLEILKKKKYNYLNANYKKPIHFLNFSKFFFIIFKYIPIFFTGAFIFSFSNIVNKKILFDFLINYFIWSNFSKDFKNIRYLAVHNFQGSHMIRNIFLNKSNSKSFLYKHSFSENVFDKTYKKYCHSIFAYNFYDYEFQMSDIGVSMSKYNNSQSSFFLISGPVWSSSMFNNYTIENMDKRKKNIGVFNTSFSPHGVNSFDGHYSFFKFIELILNNNDVIIYYKGKYDYRLFENNDKIGPLVKKLLKAKNFFFMDALTSSRALINSSDLVISMAFATPGFEALYLRKNSFFVDMSENYQNSLIDAKTEKFVSHGIKDSLKLFKFYISNSNEAKNYINKNALSIYGDSLKTDPVNYIKSKICEIK